VIVVDTSVWIEYLKAVEPIFTRMRLLLEDGQVIANECVFAELMQGAKEKRERNIISEYWHNLSKYTNDGIFLKAGTESSLNKWFDKGVGIIDCAILMYARERKSQIWTLDKKLLAILTREEIYT
jgi:predicted nucleic acid-binding protein